MQLPSEADARFYRRATDGPIDGALFRFELPAAYAKVDKLP